MLTLIGVAASRIDVVQMYYQTLIDVETASTRTSTAQRSYSCSTNTLLKACSQSLIDVHRMEFNPKFHQLHRCCDICDTLCSRNFHTISPHLVSTLRVILLNTRLAQDHIRMLHLIVDCLQLASAFAAGRTGGRRCLWKLGPSRHEG